MFQIWHLIRLMTVLESCVGRAQWHISNATLVPSVRVWLVQRIKSPQLNKLTVCSERGSSVTFSQTAPTVQSGCGFDIYCVQLKKIPVEWAAHSSVSTANKSLSSFSFFSPLSISYLPKSTCRSPWPIKPDLHKSRGESLVKFGEIAA